LHGVALVGELNSTIARQQKFAKAGDFEKFMAADNDFHAQFYAATGKAQDIVRHHKLIVTAIGANRPDDAQRHLRKHLPGTLGYLTEIRARFPEYLSG
jgi:GntR family transcriptional regulator, rspAB operon transcriptional repressor